MIPVPPAGYGGIERIVDSLAGELRARGHQVGLVAKAGSACDVDQFFAWPGENVGGRVDTLHNMLAMRRAVRRFKPDVVHSFSRLAYLFSILPSRVAKIMSYQRHTGPAQIRTALRFARKNSLRFTACSKFICEQGRAPGANWSAIYNFVDLAKIDFIPRVANDAPLLFLSRVESIKGPDLAIAIARHAGRRLLLAGNKPTGGAELAYFEEKIVPYLDRGGVEWIGEVGDARKNELLGQCAALLVPIQWDEPFGIVFAEALAAGTPVITCARGALPEIIQNGVTGFFITGLESGSAAVARLPEIDRRRCREEAESRFSLTVCTDHYLALYHEAKIACESA